MKNGDTSIHNTGLTKEEMEGVGDKFHQGLTKREHFAAMAMQGMLASKYVSEFADKPSEQILSGVSEKAVVAADALLKALGESK
jgi:hypothetical protein